MSGPGDHPDESENGRASSSLPKTLAPGPCTAVVPSELTAVSWNRTASRPPWNVTAAGPSVPSVGSTTEGSPDSTVRMPSQPSSATEPVSPSQYWMPPEDTHELPPVPDSVTYSPPGPKVTCLGLLSPLATTVTTGASSPGTEPAADAATGVKIRALPAVTAAIAAQGRNNGPIQSPLLFG